MQPQAHLQVLTNLLHHGHNPQSALDAKRFCIGGPNWHLPLEKVAFYNNVVGLEDGISEDVVAKLREMGHNIEVTKGGTQVLYGKGQIILRTTDQRTGKRIWAAGSDPRGDGCALSQI